MTDWAASVVSPTQRVDVSANLIAFTGNARHLASGEWEAELAPSVFSAIRSRWPDQDAVPLWFVLRWADAKQGVVMSGPVQTATMERKGGASTLLLTGVDEWASLLGSRVVWPQPADLPPWNVDAYDEETGQASSVVAALITNHAGVGARGERQVAVTVTDQGAGAAGTWRYRLTGLDAAVKDVAEAAGLAVDVRRLNNGTLTVTVGAIRDRTSYIIDETKLDNYAVTLSTGAATTVIAGGAGESTARLFSIAGGTVNGVARREAFSDQRNISTQPSLDAAAEAARAAGSSSTSLSGQLLDPTSLTWRKQYELGDVMTIGAEGARWQVPVTAVTVQIDGATDLRISPVLGEASRFKLTQLLRDVDGLGARLSSLEVS